MSNLTVAVMFTKSNGDLPATGLTLADIDLYLTAHDPSDGTDTVVWDGTQNPTSEIDNCGCYVRVYASADLGSYNYFTTGVYTGVTTLDQGTVQGAIDNAAVAVWAYSSRTLTAAAPISATVGGARSNQNFEMHSGDTTKVTVTVTDQDGYNVALAGSTIAWGMYASPGATTAIISKTTTAPATVTISSNTFYFTIDPTDTASLAGRYYHEAQITDATSVVETVATGWVTIRVDSI